MVNLQISCEILIFAVLLDLIFGEPPESVHPVVWFGKTIEFLDKKWKRRGKVDLIAGIVSTSIALFFAILLFMPVIFLMFPLNILWATYLLFSSISIKSMVLHAKNTYKNGFMNAKDVQMIVSRDTSRLNEEQLVSAVLESVSENFVDGVFSPLFYFSIFGICGVVLYKAINVCDAMIGYKSDKYIYFGRFAAKLDDLANFIPARVSVLLFSILSLRALKYALKYKVKLNGHSIAAMAGILNVRLEKPNSYVIDGRTPKVEDIEECIRIYKILCLLSVLFAILILVIRSILSFD